MRVSRNPFTRLIALLPAVWMCTFVASSAWAEGMKIYLSRHAESMGNVTLDYSEENQRTFSPLGKDQVAALSEKLKDLHFDHIYVSPTWRTQHTILPYLKANKLVGEIMPEIEECCCDVGLAVTPAEDIPLGREIEIVPEAEGFLVLPEGVTRRYEPSTWEEGIGQINEGLNRLKSEFSQTGTSVLLMNHSCTGSRIMELLLGLDPIGRFSPANAGLTLLEEQPDGSFRLIIYNEKPFEQEYDLKPVPNARPFKVGDSLVFGLYPKRFSIPAREGYVLKWKVIDDDDILKAEGRTSFTVGSREKGELAQLTIPTKGAYYGEAWKLELELFDGQEVVTQWSRPFLIPSYKNLSGTWLIKAGDDMAWAEAGYDDRAWKTTDVPGGWEKDALPHYDGIAWYRLHFRLTEDDFRPWEEHPLAVVLGAIDDADETYLNGRKIGQSGEFPPAEVTAWDQPRVYEFDRRYLLQDNVLAIRVSDWGGGGGIWRYPVALGPAAELQMAIDLESAGRK